MKTRINERIMKRRAMLVVPFLMVGALTVTAFADKPAGKVQGIGNFTMEATANDEVFDGAFDQGDQFADNCFLMVAKVHSDGSARGFAKFVFGEEFAALWGADVVTLECEIDTGTVSGDGTIVLQGLSFEEDFLEGVVIFDEITPFEIVIDPAGSFTLRWCLLPAFELEVMHGHLKTK